MVVAGHGGGCKSVLFSVSVLSCHYHRDTPRHRLQMESRRGESDYNYCVSFGCCSLRQRRRYSKVIGVDCEKRFYDYCSRFFRSFTILHHDWPLRASVEFHFVSRRWQLMKMGEVEFRLTIYWHCYLNCNLYLKSQKRKNVDKLGPNKRILFSYTKLF